MKFYAIYKCPMCGASIRISDNPTEIDRESMPELIANIIRNQQMLGNPYLYQAPMYIPHNCKNGCAGIAQLSGFQPVDFVQTTTPQPERKEPIWKRLISTK